MRRWLGLNYQFRVQILFFQLFSLIGKIFSCIFPDVVCPEAGGCDGREDEGGRALEGLAEKEEEGGEDRPSIGAFSCGEDGSPSVEDGQEEKPKGASQKHSGEFLVGASYVEVPEADPDQADQHGDS